VLDRRRLHDLGFSQRVVNRAPGLLIPRRDVDGQVWGYQFRPDSPLRPDNGASAKYETRHGDPNALDVPPGVHADMLGDPHEPLWITEGVKKGDCGAARGLCIVDVSGVWNWRGRNRLGGRVALPDWNEIALNGRQVIICFDGDTQRKRQVRQAMAQLAGFLATKGAQLSCVWLPDTDSKTGLDDYLQETSPVVRKAPRNAEEWVTAANASWVVALEAPTHSGSSKLPCRRTSRSNPSGTSRAGTGAATLGSRRPRDPGCRPP